MQSVCYEDGHTANSPDFIFHRFLMAKMGESRLYLAIVFVVLTPPEWVCRESEP
jgi:hypothetical protein